MELSLASYISLVPLFYHKSSKIDYVLDEMRKSEQFADDQKYILDYCKKIRLEKKEREERDDKQILDVSGRQC